MSETREGVTPQQQFIHNITRAQLRCEIIMDALDNHLEVHPDDVNWAHVGDAARVLEDLRNISRYIDTRTCAEREPDKSNGITEMESEILTLKATLASRDSAIRAYKEMKR